MVNTHKEAEYFANLRFKDSFYDEIFGTDDKEECDDGTHYSVGTEPHVIKIVVLKKDEGSQVRLTGEISNPRLVDLENALMQNTFGLGVEELW